MSRIVRPSRAFSLLETVIASFVFLVVVIGLMGVWQTHSKGIAKARSVLIANELSERVMERCVAARFEKIPLLNGYTETMNIEFVIKNVTITNQFVATVIVSDQSANIRNVIVRVEWTDATGPRNIELHSQLHSQA